MMLTTHILLESPLCGRFTLKLNAKVLKDQFGVTVPDDFVFESYNIAPSQTLPIIHLDEDHEKHLSMMQWGFLPTWAKTVKEEPRPINARLETVHKNAMFKGAFHQRRCLVPASGFYEWDNKTTPKQPSYFYQKDQPLMAFAGLWNLWEKGENGLLTFTIITKEAEKSVKPIHERMPIILDQDSYDSWLKEAHLPPHCPPLDSRPVSLEVNSPKNNSINLIL